MRRCGLGIWLMWSCLLLWTACGNKEWVGNEPENEGGASLTLTISSAEVGMASRGVEDLNDDGNVSQAELYADGRKMYRLAVVLADNYSVVASKVLEVNDGAFTDGNTKAEVSFDKLEYHKNYTLYAVANYGTNGSIAGKLYSLDLNTIMYANYLWASGNYLCKYSTPYPLSLKKSISLEPGMNKISGVLNRTYARLRVSVRNLSALKNMKVTDFSFPGNFTRNYVDLFDEGGTANAKPNVTSTDAITPFQANTIVPKIDASGNVAQTTIFDAYLLESNGGTYEYTLGLTFEDEAKYEKATLVVDDMNEILNYDKANGNKGLSYLIYNVLTQKYLYADPNSMTVKVGNSYGTDDAVNPDYVWKFIHATTENTLIYNVQSMGSSGYYMQGTGVTTQKVPLTANLGQTDYFKIDSHTQAVTLGSGYNVNTQRMNYYLHVGGESVYGVANRENDSNKSPERFILYQVELQSGEQSGDSKSYSGTIPIRIVDKETGEAKPLTAIRRNDFINIVVDVSYNENTGEVTFKASDWDTVDNELTFD